MPREAQHVLNYDILTQETGSTRGCNFNCVIETEEFINVAGCHAHCKGGTHFLFTSEPLIRMIRFVASLKLTYFLYLVDLCDVVYVAYIVCTVLFVRRC